MRSLVSGDDLQCIAYATNPNLPCASRAGEMAMASWNVKRRDSCASALHLPPSKRLAWRSSRRGKRAQQAALVAVCLPSGHATRRVREALTGSARRLRFKQRPRTVSTQDSSEGDEGGEELGNHVAGAEGGGREGRGVRWSALKVLRRFVHLLYFLALSMSGLIPAPSSRNRGRPPQWIGSRPLLQPRLGPIATQVFCPLRGTRAGPTMCSAPAGASDTSVCRASSIMRPIVTLRRARGCYHTPEAYSLVCSGMDHCRNSLRIMEEDNISQRPEFLSHFLRIK